MGELRKKPYEISIWEDRLVTTEDKSYYKEIKIAVIGSNLMTSPNRAFNPVLTENVNGEKTLTFSIAYRYYDPLTEQIVSNPFIGYLINERKIKLFYNNEWTEFLIKECNESSEEYIFNYTAHELFSLELSKVGYNITLDQSLNNNQGTIIELGEKVLENIDWQIDKENSDLLQQYIQEPLYVCNIVLDSSENEERTINVLNLDKNEVEEIGLVINEPIYIFYSYINNKIISNVQFIREADRSKFKITDDHVIESTNYRFLEDVEYNISEDDTKTVTGFTINGYSFSIDGLNYSNQGYRLVYGPLTTYDPVKNRTVEIYKANYNDSEQEIYHYTDYVYTTSDIVKSYVINGSNFNAYEDGDLQGWSNKTPVSLQNNKSILQPISVVTRPEVTKDSKLEPLDGLSTIEGYLKFKFAGILTNDYKNTYFNEGFEYNSSLVDHISAGERFALRVRCLTGNTENQKDLNKYDANVINRGIRAIVATYTIINQESYLDNNATSPSNIKSIAINPNEILLDFNDDFVESPNIISNGSFNENYTQYIVDRVIQTPSTLYIYKEGENGRDYVWNPSSKTYIPKENSTFSDYYITTATARYSCSNEQLSDPKFKLGIFIYTKDINLINKWVFLQDIQLTRYYEYADNKPVLIGNVPTATSIPTHYYYLKPNSGAQSNEITTYGTLEAIAADMGINSDNIVQVYNEDCEKILSIQASNSNCFNILQDLCETFECWLKINVEHDDTGKIKLNEEYRPIKKIAFKKYCGKENFSGFKNGINLTGIERQIDSNEIVTKLIVEPVQSEFSDTGSIDIQSAKSNPSGESTIINLSYYLNRGLITNVEECNKDLLKFYSDLKEKNNEINKLNLESSQIQLALNKLSPYQTEYTSLISEAEDNYNKAIERFYALTNITYEEYVSLANASATDEELEKKVRSDSVLKVIGEIYVSKVAIDNYSGLLTNINQEYNNLDLQYNGAQTYSVSVSFIPGSTDGGSTVDPSVQVIFDKYISGFEFKLVNDLGGFVEYQTSPNDKIFSISSSIPYTKIIFTQIPEVYNLRYFKNNTSFDLENKDAINFSFAITSDDQEATYNRHFKFIPNETYASDYIGYADKINKLIEEKKFIEKEFYKKYSRFLEEGTWSSQDYLDPELYYLDALQVSDTSAEPKVTYTINVLEVSQLQDLQNYDFRVGDKTYIEDIEFFGYLTQIVQISDNTEITNLDIKTKENADTWSEYHANELGMVRTPVQEEVIVSEIEWHLDEPDNNTITIQNYKTRFEDLFQRISATVQTVQRNENTYPKTTSILGKDGLIKASLLSDSISSAGGFLLTTNGSVAATNDGLIIKDLTNSANVMRLMSRGVEVSQDGGQNWNTAISASGISTDLLTAGTINTQNIWLMDGDNPSFRWDKAGLNAYGLDENGDFNYNLQTYVRFDKYGLYGIKNGEDYVASSLDDIKDKAHFGITWDGFFIKNSYTNGYVSITSDNDFEVIKQNNQKIHIGAIDKDITGSPIRYGIRIKNDNGDSVFETGDDGNITVTGTINAIGGNFTGEVNVGDPDRTYISINGAMEEPEIKSSNYSDGAGTGWIIQGNGDATFSNVSVRGAIKTAVFEYEEIQAVGGAFLFRPSSTIKDARPGDLLAGEDSNDLYVVVEKPLMFRVGNWVKISNYNSMGVDPASDLTTYGLVHIYEISEIIKPNYNEGEESEEEEEPVESETDEVIQVIPINEMEIEEIQDEEIDPPPMEIVLRGGAAILETISIESIPGGALIDFGNHRQEGGIDVPGTQNYGIGINSSDNYVNLPARAISLFETTIHPNNTTKVTYNYRGILGTLPRLSASEINDDIYNQNMAGTQGIYTDNMYIGDNQQYIAFYEDNDGKQLKIRANQIMFEVVDPDTHEPTGQYHDVSQIEAEGIPGPAGQDAIYVKIDSNVGNEFVISNEQARLTCTVYQGTTDITNRVTKFTWTKLLKDGTPDTTWNQAHQNYNDNYIDILTSEVNIKAIFNCHVLIPDE